MSKSILAIDNAEMFLNSLKRYLANTPYELTCVTSGHAALEYLDGQNLKPDLILMDVEMPEMNGYELTRKIKERGIKSPVVFITANSEQEDYDKAIEAGAVSVLSKPFRTNQLLDKINEYI